MAKKVKEILEDLDTVYECLDTGSGDRQLMVQQFYSNMSQAEECKHEFTPMDQVRLEAIKEGIEEQLQVL